MHEGCVNKLKDVSRCEFWLYKSPSLNQFPSTVPSTRAMKSFDEAIYSLMTFTCIYIRSNLAPDSYPWLERNFFCPLWGGCKTIEPNEVWLRCDILSNYRIGECLKADSSAFMMESLCIGSTQLDLNADVQSRHTLSKKSLIFRPYSPATTVEDHIWESVIVSWTRGRNIKNC